MNHSLRLRVPLTFLSLIFSPHPHSVPFSSLFFLLIFLPPFLPAKAQRAWWWFSRMELGIILTSFYSLPVPSTVRDVKRTWISSAPLGFSWSISQPTSPPTLVTGIAQGPLERWKAHLLISKLLHSILIPRRGSVLVKKEHSLLVRRHRSTQLPKFFWVWS